MKLKTQETKGLPFVCKVESLYTTLHGRQTESLSHCAETAVLTETFKRKRKEKA